MMTVIDWHGGHGRKSDNFMNINYCEVGLFLSLFSNVELHYSLYALKLICYCCLFLILGLAFDLASSISLLLICCLVFFRLRSNQYACWSLFCSFSCFLCFLSNLVLSVRYFLGSC